MRPFGPYCSVCGQFCAGDAGRTPCIQCRMNDFQSFLKGKNKQDTENFAQKPSENVNFTTKLPPELEKEVKDAASALENKGEDAILREIYARAEKSKRAGTLKNSEIDAVVAQISPMLDEKQRKKLAKVAARLKRI